MPPTEPPTNASSEGALLPSDPAPNTALEAGLAAGLAAEPAATVDRPGKDERVGATLLERYKLLEEIGEGGMGTVFMAQQIEPVKRLVAVKVIKAGMDSKAVLARFEAERQALALMDHPNIARVFDAGTTPSGRPFFVMELVKGVPITHFCDERRLTPRQRLELFVPVCQAIQHAHMKGIIHRDIKPSNVLVALYDDKPVVKVIDFGVAKATGSTLTDQTLVTGFGAVVGTPEYMSPEQASLNNLDIDTRSDVYTLGVLLYELLTGSPPVDRRSLGKAALAEILRIVREVEAPRPSQKLSSADTLPNIAANRGVDPKQLTSLLRSELDWIVMKALEKDRTRRYETANGFAADVLRYLAGEPVQAHPPSSWYRLTKFVRRNRFQVIAAGLVAGSLVLGIIGTTIGFLEAKAARDAEATRANSERKAKEEAQANFDLATQAVERYLFAISDDERLKQQDLTDLRKQLAESAREFFQRFVERGQDDPAQQVAVARALYNLSQIEVSLSQYPQAIQHLREAEKILGTLYAANPDDDSILLQRIKVWHLLMVVYREDMNFKEGIQLAPLATASLERLAPRRAEEREFLFLRPKVYRIIGAMYGLPDQYEAGEKALQQAIAYQRETLARFPEVEPKAELLRALLSLTILQNARNKGKEAYASALEGAQLGEELLKTAPSHAGSRQALVRIYREMIQKAVIDNNASLERKYANRCLEVARGLVDDFPGIPHHQQVFAQALRQMGETLSEANDHFRALEHIDQAFPIFERLTKRYPQVMDYRFDLATTYYDQGRALSRAGKVEEGLASRRKGVEGMEQLWKEYPNRNLIGSKAAMYRNGVVFNLLQLGRDKEALDEGQKSIEVLRELVRRSPESGEYRYNLGLSCMNASGVAVRLREHRKALEIARIGIQAIEQKALEIPSWNQTLAGLYDPYVAGAISQNLLDEAETTIRKALAAREKLEPNAWTTFSTQSLLGEVLTAQKKFAEAELLLLKGYEGLKTQEKTLPAPGQVRMLLALDRLIAFYETLKKPDEVKRYKQLRAKYPDRSPFQPK